MSKKTVAIMPSTQKVLENMGEQIKLARLRRNLSTELLSERAGISRATLWAVEKGSPTVAMGMYAAVLHALGGLDKDLELIAKDDEFGRRLQDMNLMMPNLLVVVMSSGQKMVQKLLKRISKRKMMKRKKKTYLK